MKTKLIALLSSMALASSLVLTGCGAGNNSSSSAETTTATTSGQSTEEDSTPKDLKKVSFRLNYKATGLHAPFYLALEKGYYEDEGLDVTIGEGTGSGTTAKLVGMGTDMIGLVDSASVAAAVVQGIPIRVVCPIYAVNGFAIVTREDSGIKTPEDLIGKNVGMTTGDGPSKLFEGIVSANNLDTSKINFIAMESNSKVTALVNKQVDAVLAGADNEAIQAVNMGVDVNVLRFSDYGVPTVGLSVISSNNLIDSDPETIEKFISATLKGWDYARTNPDEAIEIMTSKYITTLDKTIGRAGLDVALSSLFTKNSTTLGDVSEEEWETNKQLLTDYMGIDASFPATAFYTYNCLPEDRPAK